ncbi:MAG: hypothetical protein ACE5HW_07350, partial [Candidatus Methanofastidiosia archaeon]
MEEVYKMRRAILFFAITLTMCHILERLTETGWGTVLDIGYLIGLAVYLFGFAVIYLIISRKEYSFKKLWLIGAVSGAIIEIPLEIVTVGIIDIPGRIRTTVFFWGLLYTAINYSIVRRVFR